MRERLARRFALITGILILLLSAAFAAIQNPPGSAPPASAASPADAPKRRPQGRAVLDAQGCLRCHSIAGIGNPRSPLDGIGGRMDRSSLRDWVTAAENVSDDLSPRAVEAKTDYRSLPEADLEALLDYLASLTD